MVTNLKKFLFSAICCALTVAASAEVVIPSTLSGFVYLDRNNNGIMDAGDTGISNVVLTLTGKALISGKILLPVSLTVTSALDGSYVFSDLSLLLSDTNGYTITEGATPGYLENTNNVG